MSLENFQQVDILLVEDNPLDAELAMRALKRSNLNNTVHRVEDGVEALDFLFHEGHYAARAECPLPKVIFLDLKLPRINGLEVLRAIKADERTRSLPVVIFTSSREDPDIQAAYALGVNSYVIKPVDFDFFMETMKRLGVYWSLVNQGLS